MKTNLKIAAIAGLVCFLSAGIPAHADTFFFNFDTLSAYTPSQGGGNTATSSIQGYMNSLLKTGQSVTVTGAVADKTYNGEGYVVGPGQNESSMTPLTLGNTNGATSVSSNSTVNSTYDTFIANTNDSSQQIANQITMKFSGLTINGIVSFDYEIFPDGTANQPPDLIFAAGAASNTSTMATFLGVTPGTSPISTTVSANSNHESNAQIIGHWSQVITNATELDFIDWPAAIGIDNLTITTSNPEPSSIILLGTTGLAFFYLLRRKLQRA
jgi:hypothetical protein